MHDRPKGADLLAEARRVLTDTVIPGLNAKVRYQALMVLRAMELAEQELRAGSQVEKELNERILRVVGSKVDAAEHSDLLSRQIRKGKFDASTDIYCLLQSITSFKKGQVFRSPPSDPGSETE